MSMSDRDGKIWFDGQLIDWRDAKIHVLSHSLHYGLSVFEGVRAYDTELGTAIFRLPEHTRRLQHEIRLNNAERARVPPATVAVEAGAVKALWQHLFG